MFLDKLFASDLIPNREWDSDSGFRGNASQSGERVDDESAMKLSAVWRCLQIISGDIKALPWAVYEKQGKKRTRRTDHVVDYLLSTEPNPEMDSATFRETMQLNRELKGNAYAEIERDWLGDPKALWLLNPDQITPKRNAQGGLYYEFQDSSNPRMGTRQLKPENVLHIKGMSFDGITGLSTIKYAKETIGAGLAMVKTGNSLLGNGLRPSVVFSHPGKLDVMVRNNLKASIAALYQGSANTGRPILLEEGLKVDKWSITPEEAQFLQSKEYNIQDIARWFGIKTYKLGILSRETHTNIFQNAKEHIEECILPRCVSWEMEVKRKMFRADERANLYSKFDFNAMLRGDPAQRAEFYKALSGLGAYSINDILEKEDDDPLPDEIGNMRLVPMNMESLQNKLNKPANTTGNGNNDSTNG